MDRMEKIYREFGVMMTGDRIYEDPSVSYADICAEPDGLFGIEWF